MNPILPEHIASSVFCFLASILIAYQSLKHPNKLRLFILAYSIMTLPASIISTAYIENLVFARTNSLVYLVSTLLMTVTHFFMLLDVGRRLRLGHSYWKHPLVLFGIFFLGCTAILLFVQIIILAANRSGVEEYPLRACFTAGVICAIFGDMAVFTYTFKPLLYWNENRLNEGHSRTTALGVSYSNKSFIAKRSLISSIDLVLFNSAMLVYFIWCAIRLVLCHELLELFQYIACTRLCSAICRKLDVYLATTSPGYCILII